MVIQAQEAEGGEEPKVPRLLLPYQQAWVIDASPGKVCVKSRRIGITWATAIEAVHVAAAPKGRGRRGGSDVWYLCQSERDAAEFIRYCGAYARHLNQALLASGRRPILADPVKSVLVTRIDFTSGHRVTILPGKNPDALRGKDGLAIFDEAALLDIAACRNAAEAFQMGINGGRVAFLSTQRGEGNGFNKLVEGIRARDKSVSGYTLHSTTLHEAVAQGFYQRLCEMQGIPCSPVRERAYLDDLLARPGAEQEFLCVPAREGERYFPRDLVERAMSTTVTPLRWVLESGWELRHDEVWRREQCRRWMKAELAQHLEGLVPWQSHALGWDFGRSARGDLSAAAVMALAGGAGGARRREVPFVVELTGVPFDQQVQIMRFICDGLPNFEAGKFDATGNGSYLAEKAVQAYGEARIEKLTLSRAWYEEHLPVHKAGLQRGEYALPYYPDLLQDYGEFALDDSVPMLPKKRTKGSNGTTRHGDAALAVILADAASRRPGLDFSVAEAVPSNRDAIRPW